MNDGFFLESKRVFGIRQCMGNKAMCRKQDLICSILFSSSCLGYLAVPSDSSSW